MLGRRIPLRRAAVALVVVAPACNFHCGASKVVHHVHESDADVPAVQVESTGKPPRVVLEVGRWTGLSYRQELTVDGSFGVVGKPPVRAPTAQTTLSYTVLRGTADPVVRKSDAGQQRLVAERGVIRSISVKSPSLPPDTLAALNQAYGKLVGTTVRRLVADDGSIVETKTELVGGVKATPQVDQFLDAVWKAQRSFPFRLPGVAVGVGAHWSFSDPIDVRGVHAVQVADMTVLSIDGQRVRIRIRVRQLASRQRLPNPLDPKTTATLEQYRGDGAGELTIDRLTAITLSAHLETTASLKLSARRAGGKLEAATFAAGSILRESGRILGTGALEAGIGDSGQPSLGAEAGVGRSPGADRALHRP